MPTEKPFVVLSVGEFAIAQECHLEIELPSGTTAGPMTYQLKGKHFIVVSVDA